MKQISVVAIIAIGMTMVIITAGIDLSVGSLIAFSGVLTALTIQSLGGSAPTSSDLWLGAIVGILVCGLAGLFTGGLVTLFRIPAFIATLGIMFIAKGKDSASKFEKALDATYMYLKDMGAAVSPNRSHNFRPHQQLEVG